MCKTPPHFAKRSYQLCIPRGLILVEHYLLLALSEHVYIVLFMFRKDAQNWPMFCQWSDSCTLWCTLLLLLHTESMYHTFWCINCIFFEDFFFFFFLGGDPCCSNLLVFNTPVYIQEYHNIAVILVISILFFILMLQNKTIDFIFAMQGSQNGNLWIDGKQYYRRGDKTLFLKSVLFRRAQNMAILTLWLMDHPFFSMPQLLYLFRLKSAIWTGQNLRMPFIELVHNCV